MQRDYIGTSIGVMKSDTVGLDYGSYHSFGA